MEFLRKILAVLGGLITGGIIITINEKIFSFLHPLPDYIDPSDLQAISEHVQNAPFNSQLSVVFGWCIAAVVAGAVSTLIAELKKPTYAFAVGLVFLCASVFQLVMTKAPMWMWLAAFVFWIPLAHVGYKIVLKYKLKI
ncbi:MAG: hypothetical protein IPM42_12690 [Saprospiraceae bacterium]|nr:hypothetical protein [Saprospiraceae bacterium]